jgi:Na+/proline symporter
MDLLTLPEFFYRRYDKQTEALTSALTIVCFTVVIAGNLSAVAWIFSVVSGLSYGASLAITTTIIVIYTMAGGLFAAIWTDFFQIHVALVGFAGSAGYVLWRYGLGDLLAKVPVERLDVRGITSLEHGAMINWAAMISLAFGNAMALDFMERVFAANSPRTAQRACYYAGVQTMLIGLCASVLGLAAISLVPTVADPRMVLPTLAAEHLPYWLGVLVFVGVLGASMSTANGAMLVISVVLARNVYQRWSKTAVSDARMLLLSRVLAIPTAAAGAWVAYVRPEPGILLVIAFDIVFAGCVAPLVLGVYWRKATATAAKAAILAGTAVRVVCHFTMPPALAGLDTLLPPVVSLATLVGVTLLTQTATGNNFDRMYNPAPEDRLAVEG